MNWISISNQGLKRNLRRCKQFMSHYSYSVISTQITSYVFFLMRWQLYYNRHMSAVYQWVWLVPQMTIIIWMCLIWVTYYYCEYVRISTIVAFWDFTVSLENILLICSRKHSWRMISFVASYAIVIISY